MILLAASLAASLVLYLAGLLLVPGAWAGLRGPILRLRPALAADVIFLMQVFPLYLPSAGVLLFLVPGFSAWEPQGREEAVSWWLLALAVVTAAFVARAGWRLGKTIRCRPSFDPTKPCVAVVGVLPATLVITGPVRAMLDANELRAVVQHERTHIRRRDNLRLACAAFLRCLRPRFESFEEMERARLMLTELAADDAAAVSAVSAADLASAIVKIARSAAPAPHPLTSWLAESAPAIVAQRVMRLLRVPRAGSAVWEDCLAVAVFAAAVSSLVVVALDSSVQSACYRLLERLVAI